MLTFAATTLLSGFFLGQRVGAMRTLYTTITLPSRYHDTPNQPQITQNDQYNIFMLTSWFILKNTWLSMGCGDGPCLAHNPKVASSNLAPATKPTQGPRHWNRGPIFILFSNGVNRRGVLELMIPLHWRRFRHGRSKVQIPNNRNLTPSFTHYLRPIRDVMGKLNHLTRLRFVGVITQGGRGGVPWAMGEYRFYFATLGDWNRSP